MQKSNIASVCWGDHLGFGEGDGCLDSPTALRRCIQRWGENLDAVTLHWRLLRAKILGKFRAARGYRDVSRDCSRDIDWNDFEIVPQLAHEAGMRAYLYVSLFDDGWPLPPKKVREVSYHNDMHCQHVSWQSTFSRLNPEYAMVDRTGQRRQWGVLCLAYPEVRAHFRERFLNLLQDTDFDGLFICLRSQSRPADFADQFGFNKPVRRDYLEKYGRDICTQDFDLQTWHDILGAYMTTFLLEVRKALRKRGMQLAVGVPRGDVLGPPFSNITMHWRRWLQLGLVDELIINQNSSQCPSMWHQLWPMHRGYGYIQNYIDGRGLPEFKSQLDEIYQPPISKSPAKLYVARQWQERNLSEEEALLAHPAVSGLVFSTFRFENPRAVEVGDWRA